MRGRGGEKGREGRGGEGRGKGEGKRTPFQNVCVRACNNDDNDNITTVLKIKKYNTVNKSANMVKTAA